MLKIRQLEKTFGNHKVLHSIDLNICKGDVAVLMGPSGAGKTTLMRCMNLLERPDHGEMTFDGEVYDMHRMTGEQIRRYRMKTGFVFQEFHLFLNKTALQNVTEGLVTARKMNRSEASDKGMMMLRKVGMEDRAAYYPHQLSGGQKQRVAIARALATDPEILFFDEPTSALDPQLIDEVLTVMKTLAEDGMTMMIITHVPEFARTISNRAFYMERGELVETGPTDTFFSVPNDARTRAFLKIENGCRGAD